MQLLHGFFTTLLFVSNPFIVSIQGQAQGQITCGCTPSYCNSTVLNRLTGNVTCVERIEYLMNIENKNQVTACTEVAEAFPDVCGPLCHPVKCRAQEPDYCGCFSCTDAELDRVAGSFTCRERIRSLQSEKGFSEEQACQAVSEQYIFECGGKCNPLKCDGKNGEFCGCEACTREALGQFTEDGSSTCWDRILAALQENDGLPEQSACELVAEEFPRECGPDCDPRKCDGQKPAMCGCEECTDDILDLETSPGTTCFDRMKDRMSVVDASEEEACRIVSDDFPRLCGPACHPAKCDNKQPAHCSCKECTEFELDRMADGVTCFNRMQAAQDEMGFNEDEACRFVSTSFPEACGTKCHPDKCDGGPPHCGCFNCTEEIWNTDVDGFTCGERIQSLITDEKILETDACRMISERFPDKCGPSCHPNKCDGQPIYCDCEDCTEEYWNLKVNDFTCGERIRGLQARQDLGLDENGACKVVSEEYPVQCGPNCNPERCHGEAALCGCYDCDEEVWNRMAGDFTCLERILALLVEDDPDTRRRYTEEKACTVVSNEFMDICGPACHPKKCDGQPRYCGCQNCTLEVWNTTAGRGATCGSRILYLQTFDGGDLAEEEACAQVSREFPRECGFACNPSTCDGKGTFPSHATGCLSRHWRALNFLLGTGALWSLLQ